MQADRNIAEAIEGLSSFKDPRDLSYIRDLAMSAARRGYSRICSSALAAFEQAPDRSNLTIIDKIRRATIDQIQMVAPVVIVRTLSTHKYRETMPLLARFLDDKTIAMETELALTEIVDKDLEAVKQVWLDWFTVQGTAN